MNTYIIKRQIKVEGKIKTYYHQSLSITPNKSVMNVYVESIVAEKRKALRFYEKKEADGMVAYLLTSSEGREGEGSEVITIKG